MEAARLSFIPSLDELALPLELLRQAVAHDARARDGARRGGPYAARSCARAPSTGSADVFFIFLSACNT
eukprot:6180176-Pleurochrysis_carterae.AAC.3